MTRIGICYPFYPELAEIVTVFPDFARCVGAGDSAEEAFAKAMDAKKARTKTDIY